MEAMLFRAAAVLAILNAGVLVWLHWMPLPPDRIADVEAVPDPNEGTIEGEAPQPTQTMAALDAILADRLADEAAARGVDPLLPDPELRTAAAEAAPGSEAALQLLAAYERGFDALGLSLDGLTP